MSGILWIVLAALVAVGAWFGWRALRAGADRAVRPKVEARDAPAVASEAPAVETKPVVDAPATVEIAVDVPESAAGLARAIPPSSVPAAAPVLTALAVEPPAAAEPKAASVTAAPDPAAPSIPEPPDEFVRIEHADAALWSAAVAVDGALDRLAALTALLAPARRAVSSPGPDGEAIFAVRFENDDSIRLARAEAGTLEARASASMPLDAAPPAGWLGREAAVSLAGTVLGAWTRTRYLVELDARLPDIRSTLAAVTPKLDAAEQRRLKTLVQDLSRFVREARDNYAAVIRKPVFLERVAGACADAVGAWSALQERVAALRAQLEALVNAPRYGEVQLERTVAHLRALHEERRIEALGARILAALVLLRLALGDVGAPAGARSLEALSETHRADLEAEQALRRRVAACEGSAKGPAYEGKGEFESNRLAARHWLAKLDLDPAEGAGRFLADARSAVAAGFLDGKATDWALLLRCDREGSVVEARRARV